MAASGFTPILIYASGTASNVPLAANLTSSASGAELALNYADGKLYFKNSSGVVTLLAGAGGAGVVAGSNTQIQFNNSGVFGASANLTWDGSKVTASAYQTGGNLTFTGTGNRIIGDFSNATIASRVMFQTSTTNSQTAVGILPNGTANTSNLLIYSSSSDPANSSLMQMRVGGDGGLNGLAATITGTGSYLPLMFWTGGSERMRLDTSGNVGIGTSSPGYKFDVSGTFRATGLSNFDNAISLNTATLNYLYYTSALSLSQTGTGERMRIDSSGNVGIGTASPAGKLEVSGGRSWFTANSELYSIAFRYSSSTGVMYMGATNSVSTPSIQFSNSGGTALATIDYSGNVGIGTSSPVYRLSVVGPNNTGIASFSGNNNGVIPGSDGDATLVIGGNYAAGSAEVDYFHNNSTFKGTIGGHRFLQRTGASTTRDLMWLTEDQTTFYTAGTERMRIDSSGNVGVGTTSPSTYGKFGVVSGANYFGIANGTYNSLSVGPRPANDGYASLTYSWSTIGSGNFWVNDYSSSGIEWARFSSGVYGGVLMRLDSSGNLLLGTSSGSARLVVNGGTSTSQIRWEVNNAAFTQEVSTNAAANAYVYKTNDALYHVWKISSSTAMTLDSSARVYMGANAAYGNAKITLVPLTNPTTGLSTNSQIQIGEATSNPAYCLNVGYGLFGDYYGYIQSKNNSLATSLLLNPDGGNVGVGTNAPATTPKMTVQGGGANGYGGIRILSDTNFSNGANYQAYGRRSDGNPSGAFAGGMLLARVNTAPAALISGINLGRVAFGGSYDGTDANIVYGAQITGQASGTYSSTSAQTDLVFYTTPSGTAGGTTTGTADFGTERMRIDSSGNVLVTSAAGLGYGTGSGGTVTQATSKSTGVTLNKPTGQITMNAAALGAGASVIFLLTNSLLAATDSVIVQPNYGANSQSYAAQVTFSGAGGAYIRVTNISGGSLSEAVTLSFAIIKGATA